MIAVDLVNTAPNVGPDHVEKLPDLAAVAAFLAAQGLAAAPLGGGPGDL